MLWQLKKLSTNEALNNPQPLPENWGPIFGLAGIQERLGDLTWLGDNFADMGWVQVEGSLPVEAGKATAAEAAWATAKQLLRESDWSMLPDVPMTVGDKQAWIKYRMDLRNIRTSTGFPDAVSFPAKPN